MSDRMRRSPGPIGPILPVRAIALFVVLFSLAVGSGHLAGQQRPADASSQATFKTEASYVLTDVLVTKDGKPITDLTIEDFELREDGAPQTIRSFEHVRLDRTVGVVQRPNPSSVTESRAVAGDPRRRVFVLFLDTFHVERGSSMAIRETLMNFATKVLGPDDLIALATPQMSGGDIGFSTGPEAITGYFAANPVWGLQDELIGAETDPVERNLSSCFQTAAQQQDWAKIRRRFREYRTITSLQSLVAHLEGLREARKAIIVVTEGWNLFAADPTQLTDSRSPGRPPGVQPIGVGPDGKLGFPDRYREGGTSSYNCDTLRMHASQWETRDLFRQIIGEANRANAAFYSVDAARLRAGIQRPIITSAEGAIIESRQRDHQPFSSPLETVRTLGEATGGLSIVDSNDLAGGLQRVVNDLSSYYLLGYNSTNAKTDGRYRKIRVTVKRPGVEVRAREGYYARRTTAPAGGAVTDARPVTEAENMVTSALARLPPERRSTPLMLYAALRAPASASASVVSVVIEIDRTLLNTPEWREGADVEATVRLPGGEAAGAAKARLDAGASVVRIDVPLAVPPTGDDLKVQVRVVGVGSLARFTDTTGVRIAASGARWGAPLILRRGPSTGVVWVPTADMRFRRQERLRVEMTCEAGVTSAGVEGSLVDRRGNRISVPVRVEVPAEGLALTADVTLAPLAAGDYVVLVQQGEGRVTIPLRIVP